MIFTTGEIVAMILTVVSGAIIYFMYKTYMQRYHRNTLIKIVPGRFSKDTGVRLNKIRYGKNK